MTLVLSITQAFATLAIGVIVGVTYIWKVGLVGLGTSPFTYSDRMYIKLTACHSMCTFPYIYWLHSLGKLSQLCLLSLNP
jgi:hypothetical protein